SRRRAGARHWTGRLRDSRSSDRRLRLQRLAGRALLVLRPAPAGAGNDGERHEDGDYDEVGGQAEDSPTVEAWLVHSVGQASACPHANPLTTYRSDKKCRQPYA